MRYKITEELSRTTEAVTLSITNFHEYCSILNSVDANNKRLARAKAARISQSTSTNSAINQRTKLPCPSPNIQLQQLLPPCERCFEQLFQALEIARYGSVPRATLDGQRLLLLVPSAIRGQYGHISPDCPTKNKATEIKGLDKDEEVADEEIERQRRMSRKRRRLREDSFLGVIRIDLKRIDLTKLMGGLSLTMNSVISFNGIGFNLHTLIDTGAGALVIINTRIINEVKRHCKSPPTPSQFLQSQWLRCS
jgi:hypothetical protein